MNKVQKIRSFMRRDGRITQLQKQALQEYWSRYGLEPTGQEINLSAVFANDNSVVLEIGFGMGHSLLKAALENPDKNFIGIEVFRPGLGSLIIKLVQHNVNNVRLFYMDAEEILQQSIGNNSLSEVLIFFPDPWPKRRHHKRRLIQPDFVMLLANKLKSGGRLHLATDWQDYAKHMLKVIAANDNFTNAAGKDEFAQRPEYRALTKFERRGQRLGYNIFDLIFIR